MLRKLFPKYVRGRWENQLNFLISLMGATIGLGDVLRFPTFAVREGEQSFLIPYFLTMLVVGIPLVTMELFLGQFASTGPATCWQFSPVFRGVGIGSLVLATLFNVFYQVYIAWSLLYVLKSFTITLPWKTCSKEWATDRCLDYLNVSSASFCRSMGWNVSTDGACYNNSLSPPQITSLWNTTIASEHKIKRKLPALEYLTRHILGSEKKGIGLFNLGDIRWELVGCLVLVWIAIALTLVWGIRSLFRVLYCSIIYAFFSLIVLLIYTLTREGALDGLKVFLGVHLERLLEPSVWRDAANQALFTLSVNTGILICMASFNTYKGDCCLYGFIVAFGNVAISLLAGSITFANLGRISKILNISIGEFDFGGTNQGFVVYSYALAEFPAAPVWSVLFFSMLFIIGMASATVYVHTVVTSLLDQYPLLRQYKNALLATLCTVYVLLELPLVTEGGLYMIRILEQGSFSFDIFLLAFLQCVSVAWFYGAKTFLEDIRMMVGHNVCGCLSWKAVGYWFFLCWTVFCPAFTLYNFFELLKTALLKSTTIEGALKLTVSCTVLLPIPLFAVRSLLTRKGGYLRRLRSASRPTEFWGPALPKDRNVWLAIQRCPLRPENSLRLSLDPVALNEELSKHSFKHCQKKLPKKDSGSADDIPVVPVSAFTSAVIDTISPRKSPSLPASDLRSSPSLIESATPSSQIMPRLIIVSKESSAGLPNDEQVSKNPLEDDSATGLPKSQEMPPHASTTTSSRSSDGPQNLAQPSVMPTLNQAATTDGFSKYIFNSLTTISNSDESKSDKQSSQEALPHQLISNLTQRLGLGHSK